MLTSAYSLFAMPKSKRIGNNADLRKAEKRRKLAAIGSPSGYQATTEQGSPTKNRTPNVVDNSSDDSDVGESHCTNELSEYEKKRLENIERNAAFFSELKLNEAKCEFNMTLDTKKKARGLSRPKQKPAIISLLPMRKSLRLLKMDPQGNSVPDVPEPVQPQQPAHPRKLGLLEMKPCNNVSETEAQEFVDELTVLANMNSKEEIDGNNASESNANSYEKSLSRLKITDGRIAKVVPNRIFSMAIHPAKNKTLVFAGDKWGHLGMWDVGSSKGDDGVYLYEPHSRPINCMAFDPRDSGKLYTCSYDGTVRCGDVETSTFREVYAFEEDDNTAFKYFAFGSPGASTILAGTDTGYMLVIDTRTKRSRTIAEQTYCLHDKVIRCVDVHPLNHSMFLTSSNDGTIAFWDVRSLKNMKSKLSCLTRSRSTTSAYFSPLTGRQVLSTSMDDYVTINDVDSSGMVSPFAKCCFRHDNHVGRWLTSFRATWDPKSDSYSVVGSMRRPRQIDIFSSEKKSQAMHLTDENLNSINSLNVFHPKLNMLAGGNSSGKVYLWVE